MISPGSWDLLEAVPEAMIVTGEDGAIRFVNLPMLRLFGYSAAELIGQRIEVLLPERYRAAHPAQRASKKSRPMGSGVPLFARRRDGTEFPAEISLAETPTPDGVFVTACVRDITDSTRARAELAAAKDAAEAANRELESFSYSVAHDLRAPLRSIDGFSQALLEEYDAKLDDEGRKYLGFIRGSAQHMAQLIDDLLSLSRVTRSDLQRGDVDLSALARAAITRLERLEPGRGIEVVIQDRLENRGDSRLIAVVLDNLMGNAWKFTRKRPDARIEFGAAGEAGRPVYFVRDNGAGFDMAFADKLFGVFQRLHATHEFEGTGVGLATVRRVVTRHGGRAWAEGEPGMGATFYFTLNEREHSG